MPAHFALLHNDRNNLLFGYVRSSKTLIITKRQTDGKLCLALFRSGRVKTDQGWSGSVSTGPDWSGQDRSGQIGTHWDRLWQIRSGQERA